MRVQHCGERSRMERKRAQVDPRDLMYLLYSVGVHPRRCGHGLTGLGRLHSNIAESISFGTLWKGWRALCVKASLIRASTLSLSFEDDGRYVVDNWVCTSNVGTLTTSFRDQEYQMILTGTSHTVHSKVLSQGMYQTFRRSRQYQCCQQAAREVGVRRRNRL